jgi:transcriptional antiterminator
MSYRNEQIKKQDKNYVPDVPQDQLQQLLEQSKRAMKHG